MLQITENRQQEEAHGCLLSAVNAHEVIRFAETSFADAMKDNGFYLVVDDPNPEKPKDQVFLVPLKAGKPVRKDGDRRVFIHEANLQIDSAVSQPPK
jgi:hypothetical protein